MSFVSPTNFQFHSSSSARSQGPSQGCKTNFWWKKSLVGSCRQITVHEKLWVRDTKTLKKNHEKKTTISEAICVFLGSLNYQGAWITKPPSSTTTTTAKNLPSCETVKNPSFSHEAFCFFLAYAISRSISYSAGLGSPKSSFPWNALGQEWKLMTTKRGDKLAMSPHVKTPKLPGNQRCGQFPSSETSSSWGPGRCLL